MKCSYCGQFLSAKDFEGHDCDLPLRGCKNIEVAYFHDGSFKGKKIMVGMGTDGIMYSFEVVPHRPLPVLMSPDDFIRGDDPTKSRQNLEDDSLNLQRSVLGSFGEVQSTDEGIGKFNKRKDY